MMSSLQRLRSEDNSVATSTTNSSTTSISSALLQIHEKISKSQETLGQIDELHAKSRSLQALKPTALDIDDLVCMIYVSKRAFKNYVDKTRQVGGSSNVNVTKKAYLVKMSTGGGQVVKIEQKLVNVVFECPLMYLAMYKCCHEKYCFSGLHW